MNSVPDKHEQNPLSGDDIYDRKARETHNFWKDMETMPADAKEKRPDIRVPKTDGKSRVRQLGRQLTASVNATPTEHFPVTPINEENVSIIRHLWEDVSDNSEYGGSMCDSVDQDTFLPRISPEEISREKVHIIKNMFEKERPIEDESSDARASKSDIEEKCPSIDTANVNSIKEMWQQKDVDTGKSISKKHPKANDGYKSRDKLHNGTLSKESIENTNATVDSRHLWDDAEASTSRRETIQNTKRLLENGCPTKTESSKSFDSESSRSERLEIDITNVITTKRMWQLTDSGNQEISREGSGQPCTEENKAGSADNLQIDGDCHLNSSKLTSMVEACEDASTNAAMGTFFLPEEEFPERSVKQLVKERSNQHKEQTPDNPNASFIIPDDEFPSTSVKQIADDIFTPSDSPHTDPKAPGCPCRSFCRRILNSKGLKYFTLGSIVVAGLAILGVAVYPDLIFGSQLPETPATCESCAEILENVKAALHYTPFPNILD